MARAPVTGSCLCGSVRFQITGPLEDVLICHCHECRRWTGHVSASTATDRANLEITDDRGLRWIQSEHSDANARRGFCSQCGSGLFWDAPGLATISIEAGTIDDLPGLRVVSHWYVSQAGDYYDIPADGLPHHERNGEGELS